MNINDRLLGEAKAVAVQTNRTLGEVIDDALRVLLIERHPFEKRAQKVTLPVDGGSGLRLGVNLEDKELMADLLGDNEFPHVDR